MDTLLEHRPVSSGTVLTKYPLIDPRQIFADDPHIEVKSSTPGWTHLHILPVLGLRETLGRYIRAELSDLPPQMCEELGLAVDELLSNSMEHGCQLDSNCPVDFRCVRTARMILFHIKDGGAGFSVEAMPHAAINNPPEDPLRHAEFRDANGMRPGGFGIMLVRRIADELVYSEQGNEVLFVKYLDDTDAATCRLSGDRP